MPDIQKKSQGTEPPPLPPNAAGQPMPRRTSPDKSVTLQHHQMARGASMKRNSSLRPQASSSQLPQISVNYSGQEPLSTRRNSSDESHQTGQSDPRQWFDHSNENPTANYTQGMDVDPPFYQKETDSSNEDAARATYPQHLRPGALSTFQRTTSHSNSTNDYRSVIDDLTVEIQRLKEELKKYKPRGSGMLKKDKLFEIKVHGLPKRKKRELEATLRDFASGLSETPSGGEGSGRKTNSRHANQLYSGSGSMSKHVSSSSGSNPRPADSAYASMSTGNNSSGGSTNRPGMSRAKSSEQVENYLNDIPEGLYPHHMIMSDKEKKKLVVRRLEQLFTGEISNLQRGQPSSGGQTLAPVMGEEPPAGGAQMVHQPPSFGVPEASREARILALDDSGGSGKKSRSGDNNSNVENSNGDQTESGGNGTAVGEANTSPPNAPLPEQRPTRPRDLDPNRAQNPSENMDYIRHLGLVPPELLLETKTQDVAPDADGWVYLNLLCNLAQLHMINVTPDFIRTAVSERSAKFQLSPDGRKIRWRGGFEGTKFNSDSSGYTSQRSSMEEDTDGSNTDGQRKKLKNAQSKPVAQPGQKVQPDSGEEYTWPGSGKNLSKFGPQVTGSSESFHYKPLFLQRQSSSLEQTSLDETASSFAPAEGSYVGESRWGNSGSGSSQRKKRRLDGATIYYSGAPFCTDLSGDPGDVSPATYMASPSQEVPQQMSAKSTGGFARPDPPPRTVSGSTLKVRPLSDESSMLKMMEVDPEPCVPGSTINSEDCDLELDFGWSNSPQVLQVHSLDPCGLGGVMPDDHFMVVVSTKRQKNDQMRKVPEVHRLKPDKVTESVLQRLAAMSTSSPPPPATLRKADGAALPVEIEYVSGRIKRLNPVPLPPPAMFFPPFSETDDSSVENFSSSYENDEADDEEFGDYFTGRRADPQRLDNHYPDDEDMTSGDEEGEEPDGEDEPPSDTSSNHRNVHMPLPAQQPIRRASSSAIAAPGTIRGRSKSMSAELPHSNTSNATIGDQESGYSSGGAE